jgi:shikimate dehydrogenase
MNPPIAQDLYGIIGYPLIHSLSPLFHNTAFLEKGLKARYRIFECQDLGGALKTLRKKPIRGLSVTHPYKSAIIPFLDRTDPLAQRIGAVNTVVLEAGRWIGYNTDAWGALSALKDHTEVSGKTALLVGAGGAARAIGFILKEEGVSLTIANRDPGRGEGLARDLGVGFVPLKEMGKVRADLLIHTTPAGLYPETGACIVPEEVLRQGMVVMDIIYRPLKTNLLVAAERRGLTAINGLGMFVYQAAEQFRLWTGLNLSVPAMTKVLVDALKEA